MRMLPINKTLQSKLRQNGFARKKRKKKIWKTFHEEGKHFPLSSDKLIKFVKVLELK